MIFIAELSSSRSYVEKQCPHVIMSAVCYDSDILCTGVTLQTFGPGVGPIILYNLRCTGSERRLVDCPYSYGTGHGNDAGVRCQHNPSPGNAM